MRDCMPVTHPNLSPAIHPSDSSVSSTATSPTLRPSDTATVSSAIYQSESRYPSIVPSLPSISSLPCIAAKFPLQTPPASGQQTPASSHFTNPLSPTLASNASSIGQSTNSFALISPALRPQMYREDQEATEALMMLNTDRRSWRTEEKRGMSVQDLLSG